MENTRFYEDSFTENFFTESAFLDFLREREANADWLTRTSKTIRFNALAKKDEITAEYADNEIYLDTLKNTRLLLTVGKETYPVRNCAVKTILERARISGNSLSKVEKPVLAKILNYCMKVASGNALLRLSEGKVSAVHGGDPHDYSPLEMPELFGRTIKYLKTEYPECTFISGFYDHSMATAAWELSNQDELLKTYREALESRGMSTDNMKPAIRLSSSDVGISGANLYPTLFYGMGQRTVTLGNPLKLEHTKNATLANFDEQLALMYSQYKKAVSSLEALLNIDIRYPVNCMTGVMKRIGITKKLAFEALELFKAQYGEEDTCTAHDVYYGISEVIFTLQCSGAEGSRIAHTEETVARALSVRWSDYDIPGEIKW